MASPAPAMNLVEVADPPLPTRMSPIREMAFAEKLKVTAMLVGAGLALCALGWWLFHNGMPIKGAIAGLFGLFCVIAGLGPKALVSSCPFCGTKIDTISRKDRGEGKHVRCEKCSEYSIANAGVLRPLDPKSVVSDKPEFESPVFRNGVWPKGCVLCGEPPVRFDDLSKTSLNASAAALGMVKIAWGSIKGVPYCDQHRDKMTLKIGSDKKMFLCWTSLRMMRRYLAANRNRQAC